MATIDETASRPGAVAAHSARQQDYSDLSVLSDRKPPHLPENEDSLSSTAASPQSMGTIEDNTDIDPGTDELLPPPAYSPRSTTMLQPQYPEYPTSSRQYGATDTSEHSGERTQAAGGNEETSMLVIRPGGQSYYVRRQRKAPRRSCCGACCGTICTPRVLGSLLVAAVLTALIVWLSHEIRQGWPKGKRHPEHDGSPSQHTPIDALIPWPNCPRFADPKHARHMVMDYNELENFNLVEGYLIPPPLDNFQNRHLIYGKVHVISVPEQSVDIKAQVSVESTEEAIGSAIQVLKTGSELKLDLGNLYRIMPRDDYQSCTIINVILNVAGNIEPDALSLFDVDATHLSIELGGSSYLPVTEAVSLSTISGSVANNAESHLTAKRTVVHSVSGHISGVWPLHELLSLDTVSGSIDIDYVPAHSSENLSLAIARSLVANLTMTSISGHVRASSKIASGAHAWPSRRYISRIKSQSGSIRGCYPLGESAGFVSTSGSLDIDILPIAFPTHVTLSTNHVDGQREEGVFKAHLSTLTTSGTVDVRVHSAASDSGMSNLFNAMKSSHVGTSGKTTLTYPTDWAGILEATSISGKQAVSGDGLETVESRRGWATNYIKAIKKSQGGEVGRSRVGVETVSGPLLFRLLDD